MGFKIYAADELIAMVEYATRIANNTSTSVIQFDNCKDYYDWRTDGHRIDLEIDWTSGVHELTLSERPGRYSHIYVCSLDIGDDIYDGCIK